MIMCTFLNVRTNITTFKTANKYIESWNIQAEFHTNCSGLSYKICNEQRNQDLDWFCSSTQVCSLCIRSVVVLDSAVIVRMKCRNKSQISVTLMYVFAYFIRYRTVSEKVNGLQNSKKTYTNIFSRTHFRCSLGFHELNKHFF